MNFSKIFCLTIFFFAFVTSFLNAKEKLYISRNDDLSSYTTIKLDVDETLEVKAIHGDEHGIFIYQSEIAPKKWPTHIKQIQKFVSPSFLESEDKAFMLEVKLIYYPCEICNEWRAIGYACPNRSCASNNN